MRIIVANNIKKVWITVITCLVVGILESAASDITDFDLQGFVDREIASGKTKIVIPPGKYRVAPTRGTHLALRGLKDVTIIAKNVEMICTETIQALSIANCTNVTVRGLTIDYDPLPFTQGRITSISPDGSLYEVELFDGYPTADLLGEERTSVYSQKTRTKLTGDCNYQQPEMIDSKHVRFKKGGAKTNDIEKAGDIAVLMTRSPKNSGGHTVTSSHCVNLTLEDITIYASACMAFVEHACDNTTFLRCRADRCPQSRDYVKRADPRIHSLTADAFHISADTKGPSLIDCTAKYMGDDAVNIHGQYYVVLGSEGPVLQTVRPENIQPGDPVELVTFKGVRLPEATVKSIEPLGKLTGEERKAFHIKGSHDVQTATVTLDHAVDMPKGSMISSRVRMGNGFLIKGCDFGFNRSRGILIKASDGQIIDNTLTACWMEAIKVSPEFWWKESGCSDNIVIKDNVIRDCGIGIAVYANGPDEKIMKSGAHRNVSITKNKITNCSHPGIFVSSTDDLTIEKNTIRKPREAKDCSPWWSHQMHYYQLDTNNLAPVMTLKCSNETIGKN